MTFGQRLRAAFDSLGHLCVGIDPHPYLLRAWGLPDDATGLRSFSNLVIDASIGRAAIVKPQVAFFERHGSAGFAVLEEVLATARASGLLVIADAKRGDVGTSVEAYGQAWLSPGSPLEADAVTVSAFQGFGSLAAVIDTAETHAKGVFVLAATSNPESTEPQSARITHGSRSGLMVGAGIVTQVAEWNSQSAARSRVTESRRVDTGPLSPRVSTSGTASSGRGIGSVGVVLGATVDFDSLGIDMGALGGGPNEMATPILAPGFGHQGAGFAEIGSLYGRAADATIVAASRSILSHGPDHLAEAIGRHQEMVSGGLR